VELFVLESVGIHDVLSSLKDHQILTKATFDALLQMKR
jgi:ribosomal protein S5